MPHVDDGLISENMETVVERQLVPSLPRKIELNGGGDRVEKYNIKS